MYGLPRTETGLDYPRDLVGADVFGVEISGRLVMASRRRLAVLLCTCATGGPRGWGEDGRGGGPMAEGDQRHQSSRPHRMGQGSLGTCTRLVLDRGCRST